MLGWIVGVLADLGVGTTTACSACGGSGEVTRRRALHYEELTAQQRTALLRCQLEREQPSDDEQQQIEQAKQQAQTAQHGGGHATPGPAPVQNIGGGTPPTGVQHQTPPSTGGGHTPQTGGSHPPPSGGSHVPPN